MRLPLNHARAGEAGVAMLLVAVGAIFLGTFLVLGLGIFKAEDNASLQRKTQIRAERLMNQLASFAQNYGRIPCPADPAVDRQTAAFGREARAGAGADCALEEGIVPFHALGVQIKDATDGWSSFFTYRVSPVFTNLDGIPDRGGPGGTQVFSLCRWADSTRGGVWVSDIGLLLPTDPSGANPAVEIGPNANAVTEDYVRLKRNLNPKKAKFCCPGMAPIFMDPDTDLVVTNARLPVSNRQNMDADDVGDINRVYDISITDPANPDYTPPGQRYDTDHAIVMAFVIVSHGPNRLGAFAADGTRDRAGPPALGAELENSDGDREFTDAPRVPAEGANYYDDMLFYETNRSLIARLGNSTCLRSFR